MAILLKNRLLQAAKLPARQLKGHRQFATSHTEGSTHEERIEAPAQRSVRRQALEHPASAAPLHGRTAGGRTVRIAALQPEADQDLQRVAADYNKKQGLKPPSHTGYAEVDEAKAMQLADAYDRMEHNPKDPAVKKAYDALVRQVKLRWDHAKSAGYTMEPWKGEGQPYYSSKEMVDDVRRHHHLYFFQGGDLPTDHPMAHKEDGEDLTANDKFRAIHDLYGHAKGGYQFGPRGEQNAYLAHRDMFDEDAIPALTNETVHQNSYVNYGPHMRDENGQLRRKGDPKWLEPHRRPYAEQKAGVLPEKSAPKTSAKEPSEPSLAYRDGYATGRADYVLGRFSDLQRGPVPPPGYARAYRKGYTEGWQAAKQERVPQI
jgi:hypothetical protein